MNDMIMSDISVHLAASKRTKYRETIVTIFKSLASFLQDNGLTVHPLPTGDQFPAATFKLMRSDLTNEGCELIKGSLDRWMKGINTAKWPASNTSVLAKALTKLRQPKEPETGA